ncbi:iron uptake transporter deferrochelatase/peroxidase subunit [Corynebacterium sp. p3-SID1145]|uniref:iron uptake transporter deferrochelatase/peroxidase subunit n=1 Tax=unclassified Corynebacterium TaxID=2624378 RepID=UPI0021A9E925|nr:MULTISPECIES: iron uptake transporter deferrochelatase/peroxidase subunit [unclassified Corynebacterium]MCT1452104.1 iron uptake transporter deferrochelatase/peroxidase subunit [Corynebacterium sp. p3-SID1145]MCT1461806.1 iron uptake transporter deferrochelatase/peroxidase subunit [Corynebacterium sp. p3-SID1140]
MNCPHNFSRRSFLTGLAASAAVSASAASAGGAQARPADAEARGSSAEPHDGGGYEFHGEHQQGIATLPQKYCEVLALDIQSTGKGQQELEDLLKTITDRARFLTVGGTTPPDGIAFPANDSGDLGPVLPTDNLTVTLGVGESLFDDRFGLLSKKPAHLLKMEAFEDDTLDSDLCHGDLLLQLCADQHDTVLHASRDILRHTRGAAAVRWRQTGYMNEPRPSGTQRNHFGFKDGIVNPAEEDFNSLVWAGSDEPEWAAGGSYMVVRLIAMYTEFWDRISMAEQEQIFGRTRATGGPLSGGDEYAEPNYLDDAAGDVIPVDAHIRLANPRTPETANQLMLRRPYNYDNGVRDNGTVGVGQIFISFQQDLERQFITVQERLAGEPLADYIRPYGGGYFYALPGVKDESDFFGSALIGR